MDEAWERAVAAALKGLPADPPPRALTLDGAVKPTNGRLPSPSVFEEKLRVLEHLSIANVRLASLEGFPRLPSLRRLVLSDNRIAGGLESLVAAGLVELRDLDLSNNRIASLEDLAPLAKLQLASLDLYQCPVTKVQEYRAKVFGMIRSLKFLDKVDIDGKERPETDDEDEEEEEDEEDDEEEGEEEEDGEEGEGDDEEEEAEEDEEDGDEEEEEEGDEQNGEGNEDEEEDTENPSTKKEMENGRSESYIHHNGNGNNKSSSSHPSKRKRDGDDDL